MINGSSRSFRFAYVLLCADRCRDPYHVARKSVNINTKAIHTMYTLVIYVCILMMLQIRVRQIIIDPRADNRVVRPHRHSQKKSS